MTIDQQIDKAATELVQELRESVRAEGSPSWFFIVRRKMAALVKALEKRGKR